MLNDISGVKTWEKVHEGLIKMYKAEVSVHRPPWSAPRSAPFANAVSRPRRGRHDGGRGSAQVLGKLPVMQHMMFGDLFSFWPSSLHGDTEEAHRREHESAHLDHYHDANNLCCNVRVPSAFAARGATMAVPMD